VMLCPRCYNNLGKDPIFPCACGFRGLRAYEPSTCCKHFSLDLAEEEYCRRTGEFVSCHGLKNGCTCYATTDGHYEHHDTDQGLDSRNLHAL
jgi:hypothetical protein